MRTTWVLVSTCVVALALAACGGTSLGPRDEGLELLPGAPLPVDPPPEPPVPLEPLPEEGDVELGEDELLSPAVSAEDPLELADEVEAEPVNPFIEAVRLLLRGRSVRMAATATSTLPDSDVEFRVVSDGVFGLRNFVGGIDVDGSNLIRALGEEGATAAGFVPSRMVFEGGSIYLNYEDLPDVVPDQLPWAVARYRQLIGVPQWPDEGTVSALALTTPAHVSAMLTNSRRTLVEIGNEPIRGARSTHYEAVVDLSKLGAAAPEPMGPVLRVQARALIDALGTSTLPIDVWLDPKGRIRRVQFDLGAAAGEAAATQEEASETASGDGQDPVDAAAPDDEAGSEPSPAAGGEEGVQPAADEPDASQEPAAEPQAAPAAADDAASAPAGDGPSAVVVIDFITFSGRVRAPTPDEEETSRYAQVQALARAASAAVDNP